MSGPGSEGGPLLPVRTNVPAGIRVVGVAAGGERVHDELLGHGSHPEHVLARAGWRAGEPLAADVGSSGSLEVSFRVRPLGGVAVPEPAVRRDPDLPADAHGEPYQRVAAYAVVTSPLGVLLTQFTDLTNAAGEWGLPGGGLDPGESPDEGLHREVWEETGQRVVLGPLVVVQSQHWVGRAPSGTVEDFHAVRLVYRASCPEPAPVVVHDVGGTTGDARWVPFAQVASVPMTSSWRGLAELVGLGGRPR